MTLLEGLLSFLSPCVLPLLPVYLIYFAGESAQTEGKSRRLRMFLNATAFSLGFSTVFVLLGVFAGSLGAALAAHRAVVAYVSAAMIALFGCSFLFELPLPFKGMRTSLRPTSWLKAWAFGVVFAVGLTPCVGAFLGAALMTAAKDGGALKGALLLAEYSVGMMIPFLLSAVMIERLQGLFGFFRSHAKGVARVSGLLLIGIAIRTLPFWETGDVGQQKKEELTNHKEDTTMEITLNAANFEAEVLKSEKPVIVDFWATWCGPCRMLAPELEALAAERGDTIKVGKVNVDENAELCARYGITSIPAIFVFRNGQVVAQSVGYQKKAELAALLER